MKINILGTGLFYSGGMRIIFEYAKRLTNNGHDVVFYFPYKPYKFHDEKIGERLKQYYWNIGGVLRNKKKIVSDYNCNFEVIGVPYYNDLFIREADFVIATQWPTAFDVWRLKNSKGKKVYFLQDYEVWRSDKKKVDEALLLNLNRITISKYNQLFFKENFGISTYVILNGIDFNIYKPVQSSIRSKKIITFIEHHLDDKGVHNAISVVKQLKNKHSDIEFYSFGHKVYHDMPNFIKFFPNPSDSDIVKNIYGNTDIFIYPSIKEGFALPPAEAMACGCAVVTTVVGAVPEYSVHMESALHVKPNDVKAMVEAVEYLLQSKTEIKRISENAVKQIRKNLNWDNSVKSLEVFLESLNQ